MKLIIDRDVKSVAEFMQGNLDVRRLVAVASAIAALAPILWGRYDREEINPLCLTSHIEPILSGNGISRPAAIESPLPKGVDGGSAVVTDAHEQMLC